MRLGSLLALFCLVLGCDDAELTELIVVVDTDLAVPDDIDGAAITVDASEIDRGTVTRAALFADGRPATLGIVHEEGPLGPITITVTGRRGASDVGPTRTARVSLVEGEVRVLEMHLLAACRGASCPTGQTCGAGRACEPIDVPESELGRWNGTPPRLDGSVSTTDAGSDAGVSDAATDAALPDGCVPALETCNGADDDCDGAVDEGFDLATDPESCGECGRPCPSDEECIARACESDAVAVAAGGAHTCAVAADGTVWCWGANGTGQLGDGTTDGSATPVAVSALPAAARRLAAGDEHTCSVLATGAVWCWGSNGDGRLGPGVSSSGPVEVVLSSAALSVGVGERFSCALLADGSVACWGKNDRGQLGDGTGSDSPSPVAVSGLTDVVSLGAGFDHACAATSAGEVWCWGNNSDGQLGVSGGSSDAPVRVTGLSGAVQATAGSLFTCALRGDGEARCWGRNSVGQLGAGMVPGGATPRAVSDPDDAAASMSDAIRIEAGAMHACAVVRSGRVACWGSDDAGQLGYGMPSTRSLTPVWVDGLRTASRVSAGGAHSCARTSDGSVWCWGANVDGQLGDGTTDMRAVPVESLSE